MSEQASIVLAKIAAGDYSTQLPYPDRPVRPHSIVDLRTTSDADVAYIRTTLAKYEKAQRGYAALVVNYQDDNANLQCQMRSDLEAELGIVDYDKADWLWERAWEYGHAADLRAVYDAYVSMNKTYNPTLHNRGTDAPQAR